MEFALGADQLAIQETVARYFEDRFPFDSLVAREGSPLDRDAWRSMARIGMFGLLVDAGVLDAALVFEQVGVHLVTGSLMWSALAATLVEGVAEGDVVVAGCEAGEEGTVEEAQDADVLLVVHSDRVVAHTDLSSVVSLDPLDPLTRVARVATAGSGEVVGGAETADRLRIVGTVLTAAELVGVASRAMGVAQAYALQRHQFGVPIGSFQAVKHMLADMYVAVTLAQSATYAAAAVLDRPGQEDPMHSVAAAKLLAVDAAIDVTSASVQVLGGMGFTWDMPTNHLLKRAWHLSHRFGPADVLAERIGTDLANAELR